MCESGVTVRSVQAVYLLVVVHYQSSNCVYVDAPAKCTCTAMRSANAFVFTGGRDAAVQRVVSSVLVVDLRVDLGGEQSNWRHRQTNKTGATETVRRRATSMNTNRGRGLAIDIERQQQFEQ